MAPPPAQYGSWPIHTLLKPVSSCPWSMFESTNARAYQKVQNTNSKWEKKQQQQNKTCSGYKHFYTRQHHTTKRRPKKTNRRRRRNFEWKPKTCFLLLLVCENRDVCSSSVASKCLKRKNQIQKDYLPLSLYSYFIV